MPNLPKPLLSFWFMAQAMGLWMQARDRLNARGHRVFTPTLTAPPSRFPVPPAP